MPVLILLFNCECLTGILVILKKFCFMCYKLSFMSFYVLWNIVNSSSTVLIMDILCAKSFNIINLQLIYGKYDLFIRILFQRTFFWCSSFHSAKYKFLLILIYSLTYSYSKIIYFTSIFSWQIDTLQIFLMTDWVFPSQQIDESHDFILWKIRKFSIGKLRHRLIDNFHNLPSTNRGNSWFSLLCPIGKFKNILFIWQKKNIENSAPRKDNVTEHWALLNWSRFSTKQK